MWTIGLSVRIAMQPVGQMTQCAFDAMVRDGSSFERQGLRIEMSRIGPEDTKGAKYERS